MIKGLIEDWLKGSPTFSQKVQPSHFYAHAPFLVLVIVFSLGSLASWGVSTGGSLKLGVWLIGAMRAALLVAGGNTILVSKVECHHVCTNLSYDP